MTCNAQDVSSLDRKENSLKREKLLDASRIEEARRQNDDGKEGMGIEFRSFPVSLLEGVVSRSRAVDRLQPINIATGVRKYHYTIWFLYLKKEAICKLYTYDISLMVFHYASFGHLQINKGKRSEV